MSPKEGSEFGLMELFRFQEDKTANIQKVKLQNNLYKVSDTEAYKVDPTSVGYIWRSRFFGFGKPKRKPIVTVRVNDGTTLHPLNKNHINKVPMSFIELNDLENNSFLQTQLEMEKKGFGFFDQSQKFLYISIFAMVGAFIFIALPSAIPFVVDKYKNAFNESEVSDVTTTTQQTSD